MPELYVLAAVENPSRHLPAPPPYDWRAALRDPSVYFFEQAPAKALQSDFLLAAARARHVWHIMRNTAGNMLLRRFAQQRDDESAETAPISEFQYLRLVEHCERVVREELVTRLLVPALPEVVIMGLRFLRGDIDTAEIFRQRSGVRISISELLLTLHMGAIALPHALGLQARSLSSFVTWLDSCATTAALLRRRLSADDQQRQTQLVAFSTILPFPELNPLLHSRAAPTAFAALQLTTRRLLEIAIGL